MSGIGVYVCYVMSRYYCKRCTNPVCAGEALQLFCSFKSIASDMHPALIRRKGCFYGCPRVTVNRCATKFYHSYSTTNLTGDNSAVLVVSPLLSLMMDQVDGIQVETGGRLPLLPRKTLCLRCTTM